MGLSDTPGSPACPSRASGWVTRPPLGASRVALDLPVQPCRRHYPGGTTERDDVAPLREIRDGGLPHPLAGSAPTFPFSRPARRSLTLRPACSRSRPRRPFLSKASAVSLPPLPLRLLPAGATSCRVGIAPTEDRRLCTAHKWRRGVSVAVSSSGLVCYGVRPLRHSFCKSRAGVHFYHPRSVTQFSHILGKLQNLVACACAFHDPSLELWMPPITVSSFAVPVLRRRQLGLTIATGDPSRRRA